MHWGLTPRFYLYIKAILSIVTEDKDFTMPKARAVPIHHVMPIETLRRGNGELR
jgi:hypothetical protein